MGDTPQRLSGCPDVRNMATRVVYGSVKPFEDWIAGVAFIIDDADRALLDVAGAARARPDLPEQCFDRNGSMVAW